MKGSDDSGTNFFNTGVSQHNPCGKDLWLSVVRISYGQNGIECISRLASGLKGSRGMWNKEKLEALDDRECLNQWKRIPRRVEKRHLVAHQGDVHKEE